MLNTRNLNWSDAWSELNRIGQEMDRAFGRNRWRTAQPQASYPAVQLWEDEDNFHLEAELPGIELEDLEILASEGNLLTISGQRKQPDIPDGTWHRQERGFGRFSRSIELPAQFESNKVEATMCNGVLTIKLPKAEESKPRRISVKSS